MEKRHVSVLIVGGGPGGRISYMALKRLGVESVAIVLNEEPTVICSLPYSVGRRLVPSGPEAVVVDLASTPRLPKQIVEDAVFGNVTEIDLDKRSALVEGEGETEEVSFDQLILATGAVPWIPQIPGVLQTEGKKMGTGVMVGKNWVDKGLLSDNVCVMRGAADARRLDDLAQRAQSAVVVGTGAIGLEIAEALSDRGLSVTMVEVLDHVVSALDPEMAAIVEARLLEKGLSVLKGRQVVAVSPRGVELSDGTLIPAEVVVFASGVKPDLRLAEQIGLATQRGILVDSFMRTSAEGVYAVGDVAEITDAATGLRILPLIGTLAMREGLVAASNVAGKRLLLPPVTAWGLSVVFDLHWGVVGWSLEAAKRAGIEAVAFDLPVFSRDPFVPSRQKAQWRLVVASCNKEGMVQKGQIIGFEVASEGESPLFLAERFLDIIAAREKGSDLLGHYFIHSPAHNAVDDPYLAFAMQIAEFERSH